MIINEFGEVGLDHHLVRHVGERVTLVGNGCLCCARRDDLVSVLRDFLELHDGGKLALAHVILETTGLADPAPILFTVLNDPLLQHRYRIARVVVTVDALHGAFQLERHPEARRQLAAADDVILTKTDLNTETERLVRLIREINPAAPVHYPRWRPSYLIERVTTFGAVFWQPETRSPGPPAAMTMIRKRSLWYWTRRWIGMSSPSG